MCCSAELGVVRPTIRTVMKTWDPDSLTKRFIFQAESAERYMLECKSKLHRTDRYKELHDEHLAKFYVFNYIHGRTFLATREQFLAELGSFLHAQPTAPSEAFDGQCFLTWRQRYIQGLISECHKA